jgi:hypothetical protein
MNTLELHEEIDRLQSQVAALRAEQAPSIEARARALAAERFNPLRQNDVNNAKREIDRIDREIEAKNERVASLSVQLPTDEQIAAAYGDAERMNTEAESALRVFFDGAADLSRSCEDVTRAVQRMIEARAAVDNVRARLVSCRNAFGLQIDIPAAAVLPDAKLVMLTAMFVLQAAEGEPDANVRGELDALLADRQPIST